VIDLQRIYTKYSLAHNVTLCGQYVLCVAYSKAPLAHRVCELESQVLELEERGHFVKHLQRESMNVRAEREKCML